MSSQDWPGSDGKIYDARGRYIRIKYDRCDFSLYGYYIHDVVCEDRKLVLFCTNAEKAERILCFAEVTDLVGKDFLYGNTIKYLAVADERSHTCYKILFLEHSKSAKFWAHKLIDKYYN